MSPFINIGGHAPLSHRDRRPCSLVIGDNHGELGRATWRDPHALSC